MDAEVIDIDHDHILGSHCALLIAIWGDRTPPDTLATLITQAKTFIERWPRMAMLVVVEPENEIPNREARKRLEELILLLMPKIVALVYVFEGKGLRAAAVRTLMTATMLIPPRVPQHKIARTTDEALDWLVPILAAPEFGNEAERRLAVRSLHRRFDEYRSRPANHS